jgi:hypothetical protein
MSNRRTPFERVKLHRGTRNFLHRARGQVRQRYGLERDPSFTALVVAGVRSLAYLSGELNQRPYGSPEKLSVWTALVEGVSLPAQVTRDISDEEAGNLLSSELQEEAQRGE